jgi:hypothetical protein
MISWFYIDLMELSMLWRTKSRVDDLSKKKKKSRVDAGDFVGCSSGWLGFALI